METSLDFLSDLPMGIIHNILSFVPIREAIGTRSLSRQWRYIWTSLPNLVFDENLFDVHGILTDTEKSDIMLRFIGQVLLLHEGPIHKFEVRLPYIEAASRVQFECIYQMLLLSLKDIRILVLQLNFFESLIEVDSSLYSFQNLTHLELHLNTIPPPPPSFKGFLFLRSLYFRMPNVDSSTIESIVARSPLLERLWLTTGRRYSQMKVRAPKLNFLRFNGSSRSTHISLCTPLLEELIVNFAEIKNFSFHGFLVFHRLKTVSIHNVRFNRTEATMAVDCLIRSSPNLQKLTISNSLHDAPKIASASFWDTESAPDFIFDSLKIIKMSLSSCGINEMKLIKFLLARSPVLERMICKPCWPLSPQVLLNLEAELLSCPRASANAEIVISPPF